MVQEGLLANGETDLAQGLAEKYFHAVVETYKTERTIYEKHFGWGGLGPIANFVEYILGFDISAPDNLITWRVTRTEGHGVQNLKFDDFHVDFVCQARPINEPCRFTVKSGGEFNLTVILNGKSFDNRTKKAIVTLRFG
jgi:hypothetical protein